MAIPSKSPVTLKTNLADYPITMALKQRKASSPVVSFDFCGPPVAHDGFKRMVRDNKFDAGGLPIITFLAGKSIRQTLRTASSTDLRPVPAPLHRIQLLFAALEAGRPLP